MEIEFDPAKSAANEALRGLPFSKVADFDFDTALVAADTRFAYGEERLIAVGYIGSRLYAVAYALRGNRVRVISFRKANDREARRYARS